MDYHRVANTDALRQPSWLNDIFILDILKNFYINPKLYDFSIASLSLTYTVFRFYTEVTADDLDDIRAFSFIVKLLPQETANDLAYHDLCKEIEMYANIIPKFHQVLREKGDDTQFAPNYVYVQKYPRKLLILEDITARDYRVVENRNLTPEELNAVFKKFGKWHAVSYKLAKEDPKLFDRFSYGLLASHDTLQTALDLSGLSHFIDLLHNNPKFRDYREPFQNLLANSAEDIQQPFIEYKENPQPDVYYALNHGDLHRRNMLFKYNEVTGEVEDVLLIDFQISYMGPIAVDLIYTIQQLLSTSERINDRDQYTYVYFTEFQETLQKLAFNGPKPKLVAFREQIMRYKAFEFYLVYTLMPLWLATEGGESSRDMIASPEGRRALYDNPLYLQELKRILPIYLMLGYYD